MANDTIERTLDAMPDTIDFRDSMYSPALIEVPPVSDLDGYRKIGLPVLDQGSEGACTGFGLATVANFLLRGRGKKATADEVSAWMFYAMAKRYDEWPGEDYSGSSARGAMKGWHKHGACVARLWKDSAGAADLDETQAAKAMALDELRAADAITRPMGAYFRVNHKDLVAMHAAISEVGVLYATARVHSGWQQVKQGDTDIVYSTELIGGHAFAIVGYDREGLWIQNSWGPDWGNGGLARIGYGDWLENGTDVWVAALGVPIELGEVAAPASLRSGAPRSHEGYVYAALRPHIVTARNDGELDGKGVYGLTREGLRSIVEEQMPRRMNGWDRKRLMLHAHGGLVPEASAVQYVANNREAALTAQVYPLSFIWRSDAWSTIRNILQEAFARRRDEGLLDKAKDFMLDRVDDTLEPLARFLGGKAMWDEMKENARLATVGDGGAARLTADLLIAQHGAGRLDEIHLVGHSAGAIFQAYLAEYLVDQGVPVESLTLWAPACTVKLFNEIYRPRIESGGIRAFRLFTLDDKTEQDDHCANIYHKSLLYLVSHAFESKPRIPFVQDGTPLLGLERDAKKALPKKYWDGRKRRWFVSPTAKESDATHHGDFDNDAATLKATLDMVTHARAAAAALAPRPPSASSLARRRQALDSALVGGHFR
jgi:hypothetical protein